MLVITSLTIQLRIKNIFPNLKSRYKELLVILKGVKRCQIATVSNQFS